MKERPLYINMYSLRFQKVEVETKGPKHYILHFPQNGADVKCADGCVAFKDGQSMVQIPVGSTFDLSNKDLYGHVCGKLLIFFSSSSSSSHCFFFRFTTKNS